MEIRRSEAIKNGSAIIGNRTKCKVVKNKVAPPFKEAEFDIMYGEGISYVGEVLDMAVSLDIVKRSGAWFNYNGEHLGQGRDNSKKYLKEHPEVLEELASLIKQNQEQLEPPKKKKTAVEKAVSKAEEKAEPVTANTVAEPNLDIKPDEADFEG